MAFLFHHLLCDSAASTPDAEALLIKDKTYRYDDILSLVTQQAAHFKNLSVVRGDRVAIFLPKQLEAVTSIFAISVLGAIFVPINPSLKSSQVHHILQDAGVKLLITHQSRLQLLEPSFELDSIKIWLVDNDELGSSPMTTNELVQLDRATTMDDAVAILYTSGSTGLAKGVTLSHRNLTLGAESVSSYLGNTKADRLLALLPLSFDYGLSQISSAFHVGASVVLLEYLMPSTIISAVKQYAITGIAAVPAIWEKLSCLTWPDEAKTLRYITSSGGVMSVTVTQALGKSLPATDLYLMYGLTEAFRSTYLEPEQVSNRPDSIGKAIPFAEINLVDEKGELCRKVNQVGELKHSGELVALGYWDSASQAPTPFDGTKKMIMSGDLVKQDSEGYYYFVGRKDDMMKISGYRLSPTEIEAEVLTIKQVHSAVCFAVPHPELSSAIILLLTCDPCIDRDTIEKHCQTALPNYMQPRGIIILEALPQNSNGKVDRKNLKTQYSEHFALV